MDRFVELQGHRGARGLAPENTLVSFRQALHHQVDCIEIDVGMTRDGQIVIHHDRSLNPDITRLGGDWIAGRRYLKDLTSTELRAFDVGRIKPGTQYASEFPRQIPSDGARIAMLDDLLAMPELARAPSVGLNIEIKTSPLAHAETFPSERICQQLISDLDRRNFRGRTRVQSFDWRNMVTVRRLAPEIQLGFLTVGLRAKTNGEAEIKRAASWLGDIELGDFDGSLPIAIRYLGGAFWAPHYLDIADEDVAAAHAEGLKVVVWTVNEQAEMRRMLAMHVDGIITDYPDAGRQERAALSKCTTSISSI